MSAINFKTENNTYRKLLGNGLTYTIPRFQRDYSWTEEEWDDLWTDILGTIAPGGEPAHYMGYLVLRSTDEKFFEVIDGQQRLTTMALIVLAALKELKRLVGAGDQPEQNRQRLEQIRQTYIGYLDPVTLIPRPKLTLNRNNDSYFQTYIVPLAALPQRGFRASEHRLRQGFEWFEKRVREHIAKAGGDKGMAVASLVETMSDRLFFTVINVADELNAYKVFETLNARGVRLSSTDLLKNYLFSVLDKGGQHPRELEVLEEHWESVVSRLGAESFPDFLRTHWISRKAFVRQSELFKAVCAKVTSREHVFELLRDMDSDIDTYLALTNPEGSDWDGERKGLAQLLRLFGVRQPFPLIMAASRVWKAQEISSLLRACVMVSFRYNIICSQSTGEQERVYSDITQRIASGAITGMAAALEGMRAIYPGDDAFRAAFSEKTLRTGNSRSQKIVRYMLCELEKQESGNETDFEGASFNIEHVLPQNPGEDWQDFSDAEVGAMVYRIGNMALMESKANRKIGNGGFAAKKQALADSVFKLTRKIAEDNDGWTPPRIAARQKALAKLATSVWRVTQLS